jgi:cephalosporin-C deacetylase-like acetyl esterase
MVPARAFRLLPLLCTVLLTFAFPSLTPAADSANGPLWEFSWFFEYDKDLPFNLEERIEKQTDQYTIYHWAYDSAHDKRVTAYFVKPGNHLGPAPCYLFMHGYTGSKDDAFRAADMTARSGYCALFIDAEYHGERKVEGKSMYSKLGYSSRDAMIQTVIDFRRGIDLLETRPDEVDAARIGFAGGSMGGILGAVLAAAEPRIRATALAVGGADWGYLLKASVVAEALGLNKGDNPLDPNEFRRIVAPADPINSAHLISPRPVLMLNAKYDILVNPPANKMLFERLKPPKKIVWFDSGHELPFDTALDYILKFYGMYLVGNTDPAQLGTVVEGHETAPLGMKVKPLPEPVTAMPLLDRFEYDRHLPLAMESVDVKVTDGRSVQDISFLSAHDKRVTATLRRPLPDNAVQATAIYLHEYGADRTQAYTLAETMYTHNTALLAIDMEYHGARVRKGRAMLSPFVFTSRDALIQTVIDTRRALDAIGALPYPDTQPVFVIARGHIAAVAALMAAAVDERIHSVIILPGLDPAATADAFAAITKAGIQQEMDEAMAWADQYHFVANPRARHAYTVGRYGFDPALASGARPGYFQYMPSLESILDFLLKSK